MLVIWAPRYKAVHPIDFSSYLSVVATILDDTIDSSKKGIPSAIFGIFGSVYI